MTTAGCKVIPLTRREFLAAGAGSLAAMAFASRANADAPAKPEFTFALVSDTHVGRKGEGPSRNMALAVEEINASPAQFTVFCGDLVDNGMKP
ncbi:MAG: metallophosphoesterase, partial [Planctomycetes bacterium]|nr:metallophosphoesterase [Planctomycetota bacterium]